MTALYPWLMPTYLQIQQAFQQGHGHHALLFRAEQGVGVEQLIEQLSQFLICAEPNSPCKHCHACNLMQAGTHPDFHIIASIENKDIGVDQIRELNEKVNQYAQQNGNKVIWIQGVERLTEAAANALLKTLEEPRPQTYFLLQADISASLMATIYSRSQVWLVNAPNQQQGLDWLQTQISDKTDEIHTALRINYNRPLLALDCLQQNLIEKRVEFLRAFWVFYLRRSPLELLPLFDKALIYQQLDWICSFLNDALKHKLGIETDWVNQDLAKGVQQFTQQQSPQGLLRANQIMQKVRSDLANINGVNQEIILLDGLTHLITEVFESQ